MKNVFGKDFLQYLGQLNGDFEGFGIVYLEAAYWGVPSVAANFGGPVEVIEDGKTGVLVNPEDPNELKETIRSLIKNKSLRQTLGKQARNRLLEKFTTQVVGQKLNQILK